MNTLTVRSTLLVLAGALALASCDYSGDFLFAQATPVDDIWILTGPEGGEIVPADVTTVDELRAATIYAEVGAPQTTAFGGVTFSFVGTGDEVCLWVDPEVAYWTQALSPRPDEGAAKWTYPDNVFDDGDLDLLAGLSVYYTGSPGVEIGDFVVQYEDSLGNEVPVSLANCPNTEGINGEPATAGRGSPEYCTIPATELGIGYTVLLRTWSTPLDDDRLSFGVLITNGSCGDLRELAGAIDTAGDECLIGGEALTPDGSDYGPFYGFDAVNEAGRIWGRSTEFEEAFCDVGERMQKFCKDEEDLMEENGTTCLWHGEPDADNRCYCGNPDDTPVPGAI